MKLPSLFRTPKPQQFHVAPRYYDPIKEDIQERTSRIKSELSRDKTSEYHSNISGAFARKAQQGRKINMIQMALIVTFLTLSFGYLYYGNDVFYIFLVFVPFYLYFRLKKTRS